MNRDVKGGRMTDYGLVSERERAIAAVGECERQLWLAQASVRSADETRRRAVRTAENAVGDLRDATRRLDRMALPVAGTGSGPEGWDPSARVHIHRG
jgi:hypothetical protein